MSRSEFGQQPATPVERTFSARRRVRWIIAALLCIVTVVGLGPTLWRNWCLSRFQAATTESRWADAWSWIGRLRWIDSDSSQALFLEARLLRKQGDLVAARERLQQAADRRHSRDELRIEELLMQAQVGDLASAENPLLQALQDEREVTEVLEALVHGYLRSGQYAKAEASLETWRVIRPSDVRPFVLRGAWHLQLSNWSAASVELREALRRTPHDDNAALLLAEALLGDKHADESVTLFRRCLRAWPDRESVAVGLARALTTSGHPDQAIDVLLPFLERRSDAVEIRQALGEALLNSGRAAEAVGVLEPAAVRNAQNAELRHLLGTALRVAGHTDEANVHLSFAREANQELQAAQRLREHVLQNPQDHAQTLTLAALLLKYGRSAEAEVWLRHVLAEQPQHHEARRLLSELGPRNSRPSVGSVDVGTSPTRRVHSESSLSPARAEPATANSAWRMTEVTADVGIDFCYRNGREAGHATIVETLGGGAAWIDFDGDGRLDLFLTGGGDFDDQRRLRGHAPALFRQQSPSHFERVTAAAGVEVAPYYSHGVAVADHDQDGFPDLLVTGYSGLLFFHNQGDGTFRESAHASGLTDSRWSTSAGWGDLNGDGNLDLFVTHYLDWNWMRHRTCPGPSPQLPEVCSPKDFQGDQPFVFLSRGVGTFREASAELGVQTTGKGLGVVLGDVDLDGDLDVYVGNDTTANFLYLNDGHGHLAEVGATSGVDVDDHGIMNGSMGVDLGDFDNDGQPDIWVTNYLWESFALYRNLGQQQFQHRSQALGITAIGGLNVGWGTGFADLDRDGDEDLVVATGHVLFHSPPDRQVPVVLRNDAGRRFTRVPFPSSGYLGQPHHGRGLALADYDEDGDLDFVVSHNNEPVSLIRNDIPSTGSWLQVRLIGRTSNRDAIGAWLVLQTSSGSQWRWIKGGGSYLSHSDRRPFWGIPAGEPITRLEIHWPSGRRQVIEAPATNQTLTVIEP